MKYLLINVLLVGALIMSSCGEKKKARAIIETDFGNMTIELYDSTPLHKENFTKLINEGFYDDLLFHRIIKGFMVQGGDPESRNAQQGQRLGGGGPGYLVNPEIGSPHFKGTLAAARQGDAFNPQKRSSGSQFYIVDGRKQTDQQLNTIESQKGITYTEAQRARYKEFGGTPQLDMDYTVFGEVVEGLEVLDQIASVDKDASDRPLKDVKMKIRMLN